MKKYWIIPAAVIFLAAAGSFFFLSGRSEEARIKKVLQTLCQMATKRPGDNAAAAALKISRTDRIFAGTFTISISNGMFNGQYNPTQMTSELARYRNVFNEVEVEAQDIEISFPQENHAQALFTGVLNGSTRNGKSLSEARDVECSFIKTDKDWFITRIVIREIMEK